MKFKIYKFKKISSTNDYAINFIKNKNIKYGYVHADLQTKGRGTSYKKWISQEGNLFGSIFFPLKKKYPKFHEFLFINSIILFNLISNISKDNRLTIKWPNDILLNRKKICGILQEVIKIKNLDYIVIGIGINLVTNPNIKIKKTGNILSETNVLINKMKVVKGIVSSYEKFFSKIDSYNFKYYKDKANSLSINLDK